MLKLLKLVAFILIPTLLCAQGLYNGTPPGTRYIDPTLGNNSTDATTAIQAALTAGGTVRLPPGTYRHSGLTISNGARLVCDPGGILMYTGSGVSVDMATGSFGLVACEVTSLAQNGTGVRFAASNSIVTENYIHNFTTCLTLYGNTNGLYFSKIERNLIDVCTTGIESSNSGGNTVNDNQINNNAIQHSNIGLHICAACIGNNIRDNDVGEFGTGASPNGMFIEGKGNVLDGNWVEWNNTKTWSGTFIGMNVTGASNTIRGTKYPQADGTSGGQSGWQNYSYAAGNHIQNVYNNASGNLVVEDYYSGQPSVNAASCTGATIGTGANNSAGTITGLPGSACTVVLTFASVRANTGWVCAVNNQTHTGSTNLFVQSANSATTATFVGTSVASDVLAYACKPY